MSALLKQFVDEHSFGKYFIFDGQGSCFILADEEYDDFVSVVNTNIVSTESMYEGTNLLVNYRKSIKLITGRLTEKIYQPLLCSFSLSKTNIGELREASKTGSHIEFSTIDKKVVIGIFDYRDLVDEKLKINRIFTEIRVNNDFQKIITAKTFRKMIKRIDCLVNICGDYIEFQSMDDGTRQIYQTQLEV